jgi:AbrB family looped-hinge helix DNA binding protein
MSLIRIKDKYQLTLPSRLRERARLEVGDVLEATVESGKIILTPKSLVDRRIAESLEDYKKGRYYGPFDSADKMISSLKSASKASKQRSPKKSA